MANRPSTEVYPARAQTSDAAVAPHLPEKIIDRFKRFKYRHYGPNIEHYQELAEFGQQPEIMVVSCCDSRVDPETLFSALPGELFVVRNVANLIPPYETGGGYHGVSAALEFAVLQLRVKHIIVLGHSGCGGIRAALSTGELPPKNATLILQWIKLLDPARERVLADHPSAEPGELQECLECEGIAASLDNLRTFPCISTLEAQGRLSLHGAHYDIGSGDLKVLNPQDRCFSRL